MVFLTFQNLDPTTAPSQVYSCVRMEPARQTVFHPLAFVTERLIVLTDQMKVTLETVVSYSNCFYETLHHVQQYFSVSMVVVLYQ